MSPEGYAAAAVVLFFIGLFGFVLNLFVIVLMCRDKSLRTPLNMIILNLACGDFSISILGNPWTFIFALNKKWIFGRTICKLYGFFMSLLGIASITTLTVLAFERYIIIRHPLRTHNFSLRCSFVSIAGIWCYALLLTVPPLIGWGNYVNEAANISCSVNWEERTLNSRTYIIYLFVLGLFVPLLVIIFSYVNIICAMSKTKLEIGNVKRVENKVTVMIFVMIVAFLTAWSPYAVVSLLIQFGSLPEIPPEIGVVPAIIAKTSICYNPIVYVGLNNQFRQSLCNLFKPKHSGERFALENTTKVFTYASHSFQENHSSHNCRESNAEMAELVQDAKISGSTICKEECSEM